MSPSMKCEECFKIKRCKMYTMETVDITRAAQTVAVAYLCRPCARKLGYREANHA